MEPEIDLNPVDEPEDKVFDLPYVKKLRREVAAYRIRAREEEHTELAVTKGFLPPGVTPQNSDINFYINSFPLGDADNFSVSRAAYAKAQSNGSFTGHAWDKFAPWEKAYIEAAGKVHLKTQVELSSSVIQTKAQGDQVSGIDGGFLAPEIWNVTWFDLLRNKSALDQLPVSRFSVPARVIHIPRVHTDVGVIYPGENNALTNTQFSFGQVSYTAHKATALVNISNELIRDAGDLADQILRVSSAGAIATDRDTQLLIGTGGLGQGQSGPNPTGIVNNGVIAQNFTYYPVTTVTGSISTTPGSFTPSYQHVAQMIAKVDTLFGYSGNSQTLGQAVTDGAIAHPQFKQTVWASARFQDAQGRPLWMTDLNAGTGTGDAKMGKTVTGGFYGIRWALTGIIPTNLTKGGGTNESLIVFGQWNQYVLFECLTLGFDATPLSGSSSVGFGADQTQVRVVHRYDGAPVQPSAFGVLAGVLV